MQTIPDKIPERAHRKSPEWFKTAMRVYKRKFNADGTRKSRPSFEDSKKRHIEREKTRKTAKMLQKMALNCREKQPELA